MKVAHVEITITLSLHNNTNTTQKGLKQIHKKFQHNRYTTY